MARQRQALPPDSAETPDGAAQSAPTAEERRGMRAHDEHGNVRPADGRWELHDPQAESEHVRTNQTGGQ